MLIIQWLSTRETEFLLGGETFFLFRLQRRYYDLRHGCITGTPEPGIPEGVIREVADNVDPAIIAPTIGCKARRRGSAGNVQNRAD